MMSLLSYSQKKSKMTKIKQNKHFYIAEALNLSLLTHYSHSVAETPCDPIKATKNQNNTIRVFKRVQILFENRNITVDTVPAKHHWRTLGHFQTNYRL